MFFDSALIWQPYGPFTRRKPKNPQAKLPSWSWIGWRGDLDSRSWHSGYNYMKENPNDGFQIDQEDGQVSGPPTCRTKATTQWFYSKDLESQKYSINVSQRYRDINFEDSSNLPQGWTALPTKFGKDCYRHVSEPDQAFWYPIPLRALPTSFTTEPPTLQPLYLHGSTRRCSLIPGPTFPNNYVSECLSCDLLDPYGAWAGVLRLNVSDESLFTFEDGSECDLIELSSGLVYNQNEPMHFDEWYRPECPRRDGIYEFYNVLWIEEEDGVCYRKALGRVEKSVWERCSHETDITLG